MSAHPSRELQEAVENLEVFSSANDDCDHFFSKDLDVESGKIVYVSCSTLRKTAALACEFLASAFSFLSFSRYNKVYETLEKSSDILKKNSPLLHLWECGSIDQRGFAENARLAIERFNEVVEQAGDSSFSRSGKLFRFLCAHHKPAKLKIDLSYHKSPLKIEISSPSSTQYDPVKMLSKIAARSSEELKNKVHQLRESFLPVQARELFIMKAISLLEAHGIASHNEAREMLRDVCIQTASQADTGIHTLSVLLRPSFERTIQIQGAFMGRIPLPDRFQISLSSHFGL